MSTTPSASFFDNLPQDDSAAYQYLSALAIKQSAASAEHEFLDYKYGRIDTKSEEGKTKIKEEWGQALSGFANSGGGIVIWGIQTKVIDRHDVPHANATVPNARDFEGLLKEFLKSEIEPPVLKIRFRSLADDTGAGYVVCEIPPSELKPHCTKQGRYYVRAQHQHVPVGPSLLRILFYPSSQPTLIVKADIGDPHQLGHFFHLRVLNVGRATARNLLVFIRIEKGGMIFIGSKQNFDVFGSIGGPLSKLVGKQDLHPSLGLGLGKAVMNDRTVYNIRIFGSDFAPSEWIIRLNGKEAIVEGPKDISFPKDQEL